MISRRSAAWCLALLPFGAACQGRSPLGAEGSVADASRPLLCVGRPATPDACETDGAPLEWDGVVAGAGATIDRTVKNRGKGPLVIYSLAVSATTPQAYLFDARLCDSACDEPWPLPATLGPGVVATLRLSFDAATDGLVPGERLEIASNDGRDRTGVWGVYERPFVGLIDGCLPDHVDANGDLADGCECVPVAATESSCDARDDDCNGLVDEDLPGSGAACDTGLLGACQTGTFQCIGGLYSCVADNAASTERCDGLDNDCDGATDEEGSWESYGDGLSGGNITAVAYDPRVAAVAYAALGSQIYRSTNAGESFDFVGEAPAGVYGLGFPTGEDATVLASSSSGVLRSADGGASWSVTALEGLVLGTLLVHPADPLRVYVGTNGAGIFRSSDGGDSFTPVSGGLPHALITSLDGDPGDPNSLLATLYVLDESGSWTGEGRVVRTENAGQSWTTVLEGVGRVTRVARCESDPSQLYAVALYDGLFRSDDGGLTWAAVGFSGQLPMDVAMGAEDCDTVYVARYPDGLYRSTNGGSDFTGPLADGMDMQIPGEIHLAVDPADDRTVLAATHGGAFVTTNGGESWARAANIDGVSVRRLAVSPAEPSRAWLVTWGQGVWTRANDTTPWQRIASSLMPFDWSFTVAAHPASAGEVLVGAWSDLERTDDGGASWSTVLSGTNPMAIAYSPTAPANVLVGTQLNGVFRSSDGGLSWQQSNEGLPDPWPAGAGPVVDIRAIAYDSTDSARAYLGTNGQGPFWSSDGGLSWQPGGAELAGTHVYCLAHVPGNPARIYACVEHEGLWLSTDGGASYTPANGELPTLEVNGVVLDPMSDTLYATTSQGVFRSQSGGSWTDVDSACLPSPGAGSPTIVARSSGRALLVSSGSGRVAALPL